MVRRARISNEVTEVRDRQGRKWTVVVLSLDEDDDLAPWLELTPRQLMNPRTIVVLGHPPVRIDILTSIDGVPTFSAAWKRRATGLYGDSQATFIGIDDLIAAKRATARPQDLAERGCARTGSEEGQTFTAMTWGSPWSPSRAAPC